MLQFFLSLSKVSMWYLCGIGEYRCNEPLLFCPGVGDVFLCGMFAGLCYCVTHPIETVKTRVQVTSANSANRKGFFRAFAEIAKTEGKYL